MSMTITALVPGASFRGFTDATYGMPAFMGVYRLRSSHLPTLSGCGESTVGRDIPPMIGEHTYFAKLTLPRTSRGSDGRHMAMALLAGGRGSEKSPTLTTKPFAPP
jgi:hypothetical protein